MRRGGEGPQGHVPCVRCVTVPELSCGSLGARMGWGWGGRMLTHCFRATLSDTVSGYHGRDAPRPMKAPRDISTGVPSQVRPASPTKEVGQGHSLLMPQAPKRRAVQSPRQHWQRCYEERRCQVLNRRRGEAGAAPPFDPVSKNQRIPFGN